MATAKVLRDLITKCANDALASQPDDKGMRARIFAARLSGQLESIGESTLVTTLDNMLGLPKKTNPDGA